MNNASDYFFVFCRQVLPLIEDRMEERLLEQYKLSLPSLQLRQEVQNAYEQRRDNLAKVPEREDPGIPEPLKPRLIMPLDEYGRVITNLHGSGIKYHTYHDIGRYTVFPEHMRKRIFPSTMYGRYKSEEFDLNNTLGIQAREEGLRITNDLSRLTLPKDRKVNYARIANMNNQDAKLYII
mmetsp:Transcript_8449/g.14170  ORF Transcript_8449/g.14170 Transcript_8449/m.14170 type:complete len:180 (-) Transcript_8449:1588-2127(-)